MTGADIVAAWTALATPGGHLLMLEYLKANNVRIFGIATAAVMLIAHYVPALPVVLVLGLVAAILGIGERVNAKTVHTDHVAIDGRDLNDGDVPVVVNVPTMIQAARAAYDALAAPNSEDPDA